jgi:FkbM family methyltransferase
MGKGILRRAIARLVELLLRAPPSAGTHKRGADHRSVPVSVDEDGAWLVLEGGVRLKCIDGLNSISGILQKQGGFEEIELDLVRRNLHGEGVFIDVGANVGLYSLMVARWFPGVTVHAFEPVQEVFQVFLANRAKNGISESQMVINPMAVGREDKVVHITTAFHSSNYLTDASSAQATSAVRCAALDSYVDDHGLTDVRFIKIDVEGREFDVLKGAERTLKEFHPMVLIELIEKPTSFHDRVVGDYRESIAFMLKLGFQYYVVDDRGQAIHMNSLESGVFNASFHNYLFFWSTANTVSHSNRD